MIDINLHNDKINLNSKAIAWKSIGDNRKDSLFRRLQAWFKTLFAWIET